MATYKFRPNQIERYARRVSTEELEKNDYNLTISRYVLISVDEKITDLKEVNKSLVDIEKRIKEATEMHNRYLHELGLDLIYRGNENYSLARRIEQVQLNGDLRLLAKSIRFTAFVVVHHQQIQGRRQVLNGYLHGLQSLCFCRNQ